MSYEKGYNFAPNIPAPGRTPQGPMGPSPETREMAYSTGRVPSSEAWDAPHVSKGQNIAAMGREVGPMEPRTGAAPTIARDLGALPVEKSYTTNNWYGPEPLLPLRQITALPAIPLPGATVLTPIRSPAPPPAYPPPVVGTPTLAIAPLPLPSASQINAEFHPISTSPTGQPYGVIPEGKKVY